MMRLPAAVLAGLLIASAGSAEAQSQLGAPDNGAIAVPPAPSIVPAAPTPLTPPAPATPAPPGLVPASPPPSDDSGNADSGNADSGNADNGSADNGDTGATDGTAPVQPAPDATAPVAVSPSQPMPDQAGNGTASDSTGQADTAQPQNQDTIPAPPNTWQPGKFAEIGVLDKIDGGVKQVSIPVGGQSVIGDLQISVLACMTRPPDQVPDAAAFLALQNTDNLSGPPNYRGWLIRSEPGAAVAGDASETFSVIDCPQS